MKVILDPPNELPRIMAIWAFISVQDNGNEGVLAAPLLGPGSLVPLIGADEARLESLRPIAKQIAAATNKTIKLAKFYRREDMETIEP